MDDIEHLEDHLKRLDELQAARTTITRRRVDLFSRLRAGARNSSMIPLQIGPALVKLAERQEKAFGRPLRIAGDHPNVACHAWQGPEGETEAPDLWITTISSAAFKPEQLVQAIGAISRAGGRAIFIVQGIKALDALKKACPDIHILDEHHGRRPRPRSSLFLASTWPFTRRSRRNLA